MKFKVPWLESEFAHLHPHVQSALKALDAYSASHGLPEPLVTHCFRNASQQEAYYWRGIEKRLGVTEAEARQAARSRFSWHRVGCAADVRNSHYTPKQLEEVLSFLREGRASPLWEILSHDVGRGEHLHLARRDFSWRNTFGAERAS